MNSKIKNKWKKQFWFFLWTLKNVLSACKFSSWDHFHVRRDKKYNTDALKMLVPKAFWSTNFVFLPCFPQTWSHDENLWTLRTFVKVYHRKISFLIYILNLLFIRAQMSSSSKGYLRFYRDYIRLIWIHKPNMMPMW